MSFLSKVFRYENENGDSVTFLYENGFLINKPTGIDTLSVNITQTAGINQVGATFKSASVQSRPVNITGRLCGEFQRENKEKLLAVIRPDLEGKLYADDYYLNVRPTETPNIEAATDFAGFAFSLIAAYPYWQRDNSVNAELSGIRNLFKFPWNVSRAYSFGRKIETKFMNVENRGQVPVPFTATFTAKGDCTNPKITNVDTLKYLVVNKTMIAGETVVLEITHGRTYLTSSVDGDIRGALSLKSTLNRLEVGDNVLKPEAETGNDNLEVAIDFATEIVGIAL